MRTELPVTAVHDEGETCVARVPIFRGLDPAQQSTVAAYARPTAVRRGELLHSAGDELGRLFVVHTGRIKLVHGWPGGREHLLRVAEPGDYVGEHAFLTGERPDYRAEALTDARLCVFAHADLARLVAGYPAIALELVRSLSDRAADAERRVALTGVEVDARLADYLLELPVLPRRPAATPARPGRPERDVRGTTPTADAPVVRLPLTKKDVAAYLGTTPESLSRALARLQQAGLIEADGSRIRLLDVDGLAQWRA